MVVHVNFYFLVCAFMNFFYSKHGLPSQWENISFLLINPFLIRPFEVFPEISKPNGGVYVYKENDVNCFYLTEFAIHSRQRHMVAQQ